MNRPHGRMATICRLGAAAGLMLAARQPAHAHYAVAYQFRTVLGHKVHLVTADLNTPGIAVMVEVAQGFPAKGTKLATLAKQRNALAAVNGTFFSTRSFEPIGDVVVNGRIVFQAKRTRPAIAVTWDGKVRILSAHEVPELWRGYRFALVAGPRLLQRGVVTVSAEGDGFQDPSVLGRARRSAVGLTKANKLLLVVVQDKVSLARLSLVMKALGADDALNLDGGTSSGLYQGGLTRVAGTRSVPCALVVAVEK